MVKGLIVQGLKASNFLFEGIRTKEFSSKGKLGFGRVG